MLPACEHFADSYLHNILYLWVGKLRWWCNCLQTWWLWIQILVVVLEIFSPALGLSSVYPASVGTWRIWRRYPLVFSFIVLTSNFLLLDFTNIMYELRQRWREKKTVKVMIKSCDSPCTNVTWCNYSFSWSSEQTCQIVSLVPSSLHIITELHHHNVGHGISILHEHSNTLCNCFGCVCTLLLLEFMVVFGWWQEKTVTFNVLVSALKNRKIMKRSSQVKVCWGYYPRKNRYIY